MLFGLLTLENIKQHESELLAFSKEAENLVEKAQISAFMWILRSLCKMYSLGLHNLLVG